MDWNGDGKHDWHDDAFFNNVIDSNNGSSNNGHRSSSSGMGWVAILFILAIISFFF